MNEHILRLKFPETLRNHVYFEKQIETKDENFVNGWMVRNLYDSLVMNHARRVINLECPGRLELSMIKSEDFLLDI